jgi:hypothetical protein
MFEQVSAQSMSQGGVASGTAVGRDCYSMHPRLGVRRHAPIFSFPAAVPL